MMKHAFRHETNKIFGKSGNRKTSLICCLLPVIGLMLTLTWLELATLFWFWFWIDRSLELFFRLWLDFSLLCCLCDSTNCKVSSSEELFGIGPFCIRLYFWFREFLDERSWSRLEFLLFLESLFLELLRCCLELILLLSADLDRFSRRLFSELFLEFGDLGLCLEFWDRWWREMDDFDEWVRELRRRVRMGRGWVF